MSTNIPNSHVDSESTAVSDGPDGNEIVSELDKRRESSASECSVEVVDLEAGGKVHLTKRRRDCRICHLSFDAGNQESGGVAMELGCSCKNDLAAAHKQCAEAWFKIKGNKANGHQNTMLAGFAIKHTTQFFHDPRLFSRSQQGWISKEKLAIFKRKPVTSKRAHSYYEGIHYPTISSNPLVNVVE
ncbi:hypothetical protein RHGRI_027596 [Rhododendron griersonianum]|uniref:RING-CH-type domain-containing protein n=1 Tax=Rhododendron griersonianum TaxID=479676 RepID=A0AAV6IZV7_9ERIC|nr:hypothetical protein RHGRI_027596 [Rhododendron griersonianum]